MSLKSKIEQIVNRYQHFLNDLNSENIFNKILSTAEELTDSDRASIFIDPKYNDQNASRSLKSIFATGIKNNRIVIDLEHGIVGHVYNTKESYICSDVSKDPYFFSGIDQQTGYKTKSTVAVPLWFRNQGLIGVLQVLNKKEGIYTDEDRLLLEVIGIYATMALDSLNSLELLQDSENIIEHTRGVWGKSIEGFVLKSENPQLQNVYDNLKNYAVSDSSIFIRGESGTGKEVITNLIHHFSDRKRGPLVAINCAAIPEQLFEAELFGVAKGAATGTVARKGKFEMAHRGTLFLDEIGEMPLDLQSKLLRVLQDKKVVKIGQDSEGTEIDFRLVCATNQDLLELVNKGKFREDLYYRINVVEICLPSLRDRKSDISQISETILNQLTEKRGWKRKRLTENAMEKLRAYSWPGNIRELQNRIENACIVSGTSAAIDEGHIQLPLDIESNNLTESKDPKIENVSIANKMENLFVLPLKEAKSQFETDLVEHHIILAHGNKTEAAKALGITREGLRKILIRGKKAS
ncbi:MAG: sigma 54-interacting transcriptional regulator [Pseudobdellovibrionaceae bacterium]